ncbi:hypothetical protein LO772_05050 [Yinghuangia sp. ASG 101]|uniref:hypothetical protein n=1 Tax=Yinghuangia sp. ASG 101 TaxID=2896848 RepID=UPI001E361A1F|nr:hypothetical protein [Yinghuangia sp. ASG 101]UGQ12993.1 hypothetical protein LO772_05050 [Yinghuangia sp. ASG 101]
MMSRDNTPDEHTPGTSAPDAHTAEVRDRVRRARHDLADAARTHDGNALRVAVDKLEEALAVARVESVPLPEPDRGPDAAQAGPDDRPTPGAERG